MTGKYLSCDESLVNTFQQLTHAIKGVQLRVATINHQTSVDKSITGIKMKTHFLLFLQNLFESFFIGSDQNTYTKFCFCFQNKRHKCLMKKMNVVVVSAVVVVAAAAAVDRFLGSLMFFFSPMFFSEFVLLEL